MVLYVIAGFYACFDVASLGDVTDIRHRLALGAETLRLQG